MLKRMICALMLAALVFPAVCAFAEARVVWNDSRYWDERLNLRAGPDKGAQSLGRYYTGTRVQVLEDTGDWCRVRIATGTRGARTEGYMMSQYLRSTDGWMGAGLLPYGTLTGNTVLTDAQGTRLEGGQLAAGGKVYVMGVDGSRVHAVTEDGLMGYLPLQLIEGGLRCPEDDEKMLLDTVGTPAEGAVLRESPAQDAPAIATLYGGVRLEDSLFTARRDAVLAALGDREDAARGFLAAGSWTYWDNGANCGCMYPVCQQDGELVEVLGQMADGRYIVRRGGAVTLEEETALTGAVSLRGEPGDTTFFYDAPMKGEISDDEAVRCAIKGLIDAAAEDEATSGLLTREALGAMRASVIRAVQPQWEVTMLFVEFTDDAGVRHAYAELWPDDGRFVAAGGNG